MHFYSSKHNFGQNSPLEGFTLSIWSAANFSKFESVDNGAGAYFLDARLSVYGNIQYNLTKDSDTGSHGGPLKLIFLQLGLRVP